MQINRTILPGNTLQELLRPASFYKAGAFEPGPEMRPQQDADLAGAPEVAEIGRTEPLDTETALAIDPAEKMLALNVWTDTSRSLRAEGLESEAPLHAMAGDSSAALAGYILQGWS